MLRLSRRQTSLFVRSIKSKLLKLIKRDTEVEMLRQYDRTKEVKMNRHPDSGWYVKALIIKKETRYWSTLTSQRRRTIHLAFNLTRKGQ